MNTRDRYTGELVESSPMHSQRFLPAGVKKGGSSPETKVDRGYIPLSENVKRMQDAGLRLVAARRARFDSVELGAKDDDDLPLDPLREPGLDLVDLKAYADKAKKAVDAFQESIKLKEEEKADAARKAEVAKAVEKALAEQSQKA